MNYGLRIINIPNALHATKEFSSSATYKKKKPSSLPDALDLQLLQNCGLDWWLCIISRLIAEIDVLCEV